MCDDNKEKSKIETLFKLAIHIYEEEERRNKIIETKSNYLITLTGVMLTIYSTIILKDITLLNVISFLRIFPIVLYIVSLIFFLKTLDINNFEQVPNSKDLVKWFENKPKNTYVNIVEAIIGQIDVALNNNEVILNCKLNRWKIGYSFLIFGIIFMIISVLI